MQNNRIQECIYFVVKNNLLIVNLFFIGNKFDKYLIIFSLFIL